MNTSKKKTILIVEDNVVIANQMKEILSVTVDESYITLDGKEGLDFLKRNPDVSCIISDILMPNMNGIEFIKAVRKESNDVPFVFFSSFGQDELLKEVVKYGAIDFITKPNFENLSYAVETAFKSNFYRNETDKTPDQLVSEMNDLLGNILD